MQPIGQRHDRIDLLSHPGRDDELSTTVAAPGSQLVAVQDTSVVQKMLSATTGSILTSLLVTPLDVVRIRLQAKQSPSPPSMRIPSFLHLPPDLGVTACCREVFWVQNQSQFCVASPGGIQAAAAATPPISASPNGVVLEASVVSDCAAEETQRRTFNSTLDGLRKIARNEGILTLWRGLSPTLLMAIPANVIYFAGYDWLRTSQRSPMIGKVSDTYAPLAAGSIARVMAALCVSPIEMLRTRMQADFTGEKAIMRATMIGLRDMVSTEGYTSLWRGLTLTLWRDVPFSAFYWWGYEYGRQHLHDARARASSTATSTGTGVGTGTGTPNELSTSSLLTDSFIAGAGSGAIAAFVTTPFDVGKTRQQTVLHDASACTKDIPETRSMPRFLWHIYSNEGPAGLFKGWGPRCLKVAPACAIMISSYEIGKKLASNANERRDAS